MFGLFLRAVGLYVGSIFMEAMIDELGKVMKEKENHETELLVINGEKE